MDTSKVTNISYMFNKCKSLISLPDISIWNTSNVDDMSALFNECKSLISLPDISKWNISKVINKRYIFDGCINCLNTTPKSIKRNNFYRFNHIK